MTPHMGNNGKNGAKHGYNDVSNTMVQRCKAWQNWWNNEGIDTKQGIIV
jgi:hypothetical protein